MIDNVPDWDTVAELERLTLRWAFTRLILSDYPLTVERLCYKERYREPVLQPWGRCWLCAASVEDEVHALLECDGDVRLIALHAACREDIARINLQVATWWSSSLHFLTELVHDSATGSHLRKYICDVFAVYNSVPIIPSPYLYNSRI